MYKDILTKRERQIFELLIINKTTKEIAELLNINEKTVCPVYYACPAVRNHISNTIQKLGVSSRTQAIITLLKNGLIKVD